MPYSGIGSHACHQWVKITAKKKKKKLLFSYYTPEILITRDMYTSLLQQKAKCHTKTEFNCTVSHTSPRACTQVLVLADTQTKFL